jgi:acyl-phosphate glycerol 3-phosphate acyltransferase
MDWLALVLMPLAGYLIGSIPFGYLVARGRGIDIFKMGSGNIGATNVGRVLGRPFGALVFALDFAKGAVPVLVAGAVGRLWLDAARQEWLEVLTGLAAFLGHLYPLYLGLHGGKGVATATGVVAVLLPGPALVALAIWLVVVIATRYVSVASILAVLGLVAARLVETDEWTSPRTLFCLLAGALVIVKHRSNLARLAKGSENQLRESPAMTHLSKSLHVLAVGLWFGATVFFSFVVGLSLFGSFEQLGTEQPRPSWFPLPAEYSRNDRVNGPKEQGTRAAGFAVSPMFRWYFLLQGVCGFIALATALPWSRLGGVHRWRQSLQLTATVLVLVGWAVEQKVEGLRDPRNSTTEAYLQTSVPDEALCNEMQSARSAFGTWHLVSLMLNLAVIVCVTGATALAAHLPAERSIPSEPRPSGSGEAKTAP